MLKKRFCIELFHEIFVTVFYLLRLNRSLALAAWQDYNAVNRDNGTDGISSLFLHSLWKWPQFSPAFQTQIIVTQGWRNPSGQLGYNCSHHFGGNSCNLCILFWFLDFFKLNWGQRFFFSFFVDTVCVRPR